MFNVQYISCMGYLTLFELLYFVTIYRPCFYFLAVVLYFVFPTTLPILVISLGTTRDQRFKKVYPGPSLPPRCLV